MLDYIDNNPASGFFANQVLGSVFGSEDFTGTKTIDDANNLLINGYHDGAARVKKHMGKPDISGGRRVLYNSVVGFAPNVPAYIQGSPLSMINARKTRAPQRVVTICYNSAVGICVSAAQIEEAAAKLFNIVAGLEASGCRVDLWVLLLCKKHNEDINAALKIKSSSQPLNLLKMIYPVIHPSFLRRHGLALIERAGVIGDAWGNYGSPVMDRAESVAKVKKMGIDTDNVFSYYDICDKTEKEIAQMIK